MKTFHQRFYCFRPVFILLMLFLIIPGLSQAADMDKGDAIKRLNAFAAEMLKEKPFFLGYPVNQDTNLQGFYKWYFESGLYEAAMNNVGDPRKADIIRLSTHAFENEVIDYFAPRFGFDRDYWGFVTYSGTDGNNHGMYFGKKVLSAKSNLPLVAYVSDEAHYSIKKLADVQGLELRLIKTHPMGQMDLADFEAKLDPKRPALVVIAIGTTFKGAIDDQLAIDKILAKVHPPAVYRHLDAALFGSILSFVDGPAHDIVNMKKMKFDSIAVSGHKFWGLDEPMGIFVTTMNVRNSINPFRVEYLKDAVPTITCSRSAIAPLKLWWKITFTPAKSFEEQAGNLIANARYLNGELKKRGIKSWLNENSNTVFFQRPSQKIMDKYGLAPEKSPQFGELAHVIVMQHVHRPLIDQFVAEMDADINRK
jgi:histidine decarboxylase